MPSPCGFTSRPIHDQSSAGCCSPAVVPVTQRQSAEYNVHASDYRDHRPLTGDGMNLWENHGWMVWDRQENSDLLLWVSPYRVIGRQPSGPFALSDVALSQTLLLHTEMNADERESMHDTPFLAVGYDLGDHLPGDALRVEVDEAGTSWNVGERSFRATPPRWQVTGRHAGVNVDLDFEATQEALWLTDPDQPIADSEDRWFLVDARVQGSVTTDEKTFQISGHGSHERHVHLGTRYDPVALLSSRGITWHSAAKDDIQLLLLSRPSLGHSWARLKVGDSSVAFDAASGDHCDIVETAHWQDPQSNLMVPSAWRGFYSNSQGTLAVNARAFARAYYLWPHFKHGCTVLYWWLADATIEYQLTNGDQGFVEHVQYIAHDNRLLYRRHIND